MIVLVVAASAAAALVATLPPLDRATFPPRVGATLNEVVVWGYQLQRVTPSTIPDAVDLLITDYSRDGTAAGAWTAAEVDALRHRAGGKSRIVLAYLSIGEAETYRGYWHHYWRLSPPSWLGAENAAWRGNFAVRYWQPGWQKLIFDASPDLFARVVARWIPAFAADTYLDRILAAGFDGVFLDKVDAYEDWTAERPGAAGDMVRFVGAIADYARTRKPGFLVVPQNAEDLLLDASYLAKIDAITKEDLFFGIAGDGKPNLPDDVAAAEAALGRASTAGLPIFVVEYGDDPVMRQTVRKQAEVIGFRPLFASRDLNQPPQLPTPGALPPEPGPAPGPELPATPEATR